MQPHGGQQIITSTKIKAVEGDWNPSRIAVVAFSSMDTATTWYNFPAYLEILLILSPYTDDKTILGKVL